MRTEEQAAAPYHGCAPLSSAPAGPVFTSWEWANLQGPVWWFRGDDASESNNSEVLPLREYDGRFLVSVHLELRSGARPCPPCPRFANCKTCEGDGPDTVKVLDEAESSAGRELMSLEATGLHQRFGNEFWGILEVSGGGIVGCYERPSELPPHRVPTPVLPDVMSATVTEDLAADLRRSLKEQIADQAPVATVETFTDWVGQTSVLYPSRPLVEAQAENKVPAMKRCAAVRIADGDVDGGVVATHRLRWPRKEDDGSVAVTHVAVSLSPLFKIALSKTYEKGTADNGSVRASSGDVWTSGGVLAPTRWDAEFVEFGARVGMPVFGCGQGTVWRASCETPYFRECSNCEHPYMMLRQVTNGASSVGSGGTSRTTMVHHSMCFGDCPLDPRLEVLKDFRERYGNTQYVHTLLENDQKVRFYKKRTLCLADRDRAIPSQ